MKKKNYLEDAEQASLFRALAKYYPAIRQLTFAIPNGGFRTTTEAKRLQDCGVTSGVPDIFCAFPAGNYHGLFIEMKRPATRNSSKGRLSTPQKAMIQIMLDQGYSVKVCYGASEALEEILQYWNLYNI